MPDHPEVSDMWMPHVALNFLGGKRCISSEYTQATSTDRPHPEGL